MFGERLRVVVRVRDDEDRLLGREREVVLLGEDFGRCGHEDELVGFRDGGDADDVGERMDQAGREIACASRAAGDGLGIGREVKGLDGASGIGDGRAREKDRLV